jgi:hypothetical protein
LDRVPGYEPGGRGFKSCRARHRIQGLAAMQALLLFGAAAKRLAGPNWLI